MVRVSGALAALLLASACSTSVPSDVPTGISAAAEADFEARQAWLRGEGSIVPPGGSAEAILAGGDPALTGAALGGDNGATDIATRAAAAIAEAEALPQAAPARPSAPGISDEQDFAAVSARETIESDAERLARMQAQRVVVSPTALPDRPEGLGPNIIDYALSTSHPVGQRVHRRSPFAQGRHEANCRSFRSDDLAQEWFLANGGPERDRRALDPDGDGYACGWNPQVFRSAARASGN